jgi:hypothetical protein
MKKSYWLILSLFVISLSIAAAQSSHRGIYKGTCKISINGQEAGSVSCKVAIASNYTAAPGTDSVYVEILNQGHLAGIEWKGSSFSGSYTTPSCNHQVSGSHKGGVLSGTSTITAKLKFQVGANNRYPLKAGDVATISFSCR